MRHRVSDDLYDRLTSKFTARQIIDLCFTAGLAGTINRFHATFRTEVDRTTAENEDVVELTPRLDPT